MGWKKTVLGILMAIVCTTLVGILLFDFVIFENLLIACLPIFCMFLLIFTSIYGIIKKVNIKFNIWGLAMGINGIVMVLLFAFSNYIIFIMSFVIFLILAMIGGRLEQFWK